MRHKESVGRLSTESNPDNMNIHVQMRKSPSFDLDPQIEARIEESDLIKTRIQLKAHQIRLTSACKVHVFFLKEAHVLVAKEATKDLGNSPTKEVTSASPIAKEKHKRGTSLFGHCMCCATVID
ncbi:hypothetical protein OIU78_004598 [Salix suchowensis]|nr:hypothetical protein OIU78_004598 [Salix suchowensis]